MPVVPIMAYIGTAMGASAATAAAVGVATTATVASVAGQGYSMYETNKAGKQAAGVALSVGQYNARVDENQAKQLELDADANIANARRSAAIYTSRQRAAYASSGVLSSGSPLAVEATTAGRFEQQIQQMKVNTGQEAAKARAAGSVGILYAQAQADAIRTQTESALVRGGVGILSTVSGAYGSGQFSGLGGNWGNFDKIDFTGNAPSFHY
jgi:hypothetical protein